MNKRLRLATGLLLAMACASAVLSPAVALAKASDITTTDHTMRASKLIGMTVYNNENTAVGKVEDILVTEGATEPTVILSVGGFLGLGSKLVKVPLGHVHLAADKFAMPTATKEHLAGMPAWAFTGLEGGGG